MPNLPHLRPDHDELLVVRLAADDLADAEAERARDLVATCPACADLLADIRSLTAATAALPTLRRTRDFRLTEADAARLRPGGWRGWLARFGGRGFGFATPLAGGLAALGVAGLLIATLPGGLSGSGSADSRMSTSGGAVTDQALGAAPSIAAGDIQASMAPLVPGGAEAGGPAASPATGSASSVPAPAKGVAPAASAPAASVEVVPAPAASQGPEASGAPAVGNLASGQASGSPAPAARPAGPTDTTASGSGASSPLVPLSILLVVAGVGLAVLRWAGRRVV